VDKQANTRPDDDVTGPQHLSAYAYWKTTKRVVVTVQLSLAQLDCFIFKTLALVYQASFGVFREGGEVFVVVG
jgi:hypothetical protein